MPLSNNRTQAVPGDTEHAGVRLALAHYFQGYATDEAIHMREAFSGDGGHRGHPRGKLRLVDA